MEKKILESLSDVVIIVDKNGIIVDANSAIEDTFVWKKEEVIGQPLEILLPDRSRKGHKELFKTYLRNPISRRMGEDKGRKFQGQDKNGCEFYVDIALSSFQPDSGEMLYTAIVRDVSPIMKIRNELEMRLAELASKNAELDQFAYIVSHDLKAPARNVKSLVECIREDHPNEIQGEVSNLFDLIQQRVDRMSELIDGILQYSRAGEEGEGMQFTDLTSFVLELVDSLGIPSEFNIDIDVPSLTVNIQKVQLGQVLANIIGNAIKYHHKTTGKISIACHSTIDELEFKVSDDGPGIQPKYHQTIFEMFGTAHEQSRSDSTGIGLAIVKKIVEKNGGVIQMRSELGKGTTFIFTWKLLNSVKTR